MTTTIEALKTKIAETTDPTVAAILTKELKRLQKSADKERTEITLKDKKDREGVLKVGDRLFRAHIYFGSTSRFSKEEPKPHITLGKPITAIAPGTDRVAFSTHYGGKPDYAEATYWGGGPYYAEDESDNPPHFVIHGTYYYRTFADAQKALAIKCKERIAALNLDLDYAARASALAQALKHSDVNED